MLSHNEVDARIDAKTIQIWYSFLPNSAGGFDYHENDLAVDLSLPETAATRFFQKNRYSTHVHLTAGPIVKSHHGIRVGGRQGYGNHPNCFDLRLQDNKIIVEPSEMLTILTNERIALDGKTAAIVTPRVTNTDSGLILTTAYIDPFYNGICRVVVCNMTPQRQTLCLLEPLAQCFFFDLSSSVAEAYRESFSQKSVFYGHTWRRLLANTNNPFPQLKSPNPSLGWFERFKLAMRNAISYITYEKVFAAIGLLGGVVGLYTLVNFNTTIEGYKGLKTDVDALANRLPRVEHSPLFGSRVILIPAGATEGRRRMNIPIPSMQLMHVWMSVDRASATIQDEIDLSYDLMPSGTSGDTVVELIARVRNGPASADVRVPVLWIITRQTL